MKKNDEGLMAVEVFLWRMLRISCAEKKSNLEVLRAAVPDNEDNSSKTIQFPGSRRKVSSS